MAVIVYGQSPLVVIRATAVRVEPEVASAVDRFVQQDGATYTEMVRRLITDGIRRRLRLPADWPARSPAPLVLVPATAVRMEPEVRDAVDRLVRQESATHAEVVRALVTEAVRHRLRAERPGRTGRRTG